MNPLTFKQVSHDKAMLYGMPNLGASYTRDNVNATRVDGGARCPICLRMASQAHHCPPKSTARSILLQSEWGQFVLKPALIGVCVECHMRIHRHEITPKWVWFDPISAERWEGGYLLSHGYSAHSPKLNELGKWTFERRGGVQDGG